MGIQADLLDIGNTIAQTEPVIVLEHHTTQVVVRWANVTAFLPGLAIEATYKTQAGFDADNVHSIEFTLLDAAYGDSSTRINADPKFADEYEDDYFEHFLNGFRQYTRRSNTLTPLGFSGLAARIAVIRAADMLAAK